MFKSLSGHGFIENIPPSNKVVVILAKRSRLGQGSKIALVRSYLRVPQAAGK